MKIQKLATLAAVATVMLFAPVAAMAEKKVIATVDGVEITENDLKFLELEIGQDLKNIPPAQRRMVLVEFLIENQVLVNAAEKKKLEETDEFSNRQKYYRKRILRDIYVEKFVRGEVTDEEAKKAYDEQVKKIKPEKEVRASHILVKTEKEAKEIHAQLKKGADFAKLAKEKSTGPSKVNGGDLNFFTQGRMVPAFDKAVFAMKKGEISEPVKTQFGWHIIKLTDERQRPIPAFDLVKDRLVQSLQQQKAQKNIRDLRTAAKVDITDENLKKQMEAARGSFSGATAAEKKEEKKK